MQEKIRNRNFSFKSSPKPCIALLILMVVCFSNAAISKNEQQESDSTFHTADPNADKPPVNTKKIREKIEQFLSLDDSNPAAGNSHIYYNIAAEILSHDELLDLAEKVIKKGIEVNTIKNLRKTYPDMPETGIKHQQKLEFGRLYSQHAWLLWKKSRPENALSEIKKAMSYISSPTSNDYIRLGIIEYENGKKQQGWNHITKALVMDTIIEQQNPEYRKALYKIIEDKHSKEKEPAVFINEHRNQNAQMLPGLSLLTLNNIEIKLNRFNGQVIFINFFNPACSSCQQEIPSIKNLYKKLSSEKDVVFIFILNRPELKQQAIDLFEKSGIDKPTIAVLENGSVWDYIVAEPSIWVTDKSGKVIFRHSGYKQGDELIYQKKLSQLMQN